MIIAQSPKPQVQFFSYDTGDCYQTFSANSTDISGKNLQSYSFDKSIGNFAGSFQLTVKEDTRVTTDLFMDKVNHLDIVKIAENGVDVNFIGVVTTISFGATASNTKKTISISGMSIEYLFELFCISGDVTAMSFYNSEVSQIDLITQLNSGNMALTVANAVETIFNVFTGVAEKYNGISSIGIKALIDRFYGNSVSSWLDSGALTFRYPVTSNFFNNGTMKIFQMVRNLLPEEVYEIYGYIENGNPKIKIREVPFDDEVFGNLYETVLNPAWVTDFTMTKTNNEVYTAFLSYLEGSLQSPEFYKKIEGSTSGYQTAEHEEKILSLYGYRPKYVNFIGYGIQDSDESQAQSDQALTDSFSSLNERMKNWYGRLQDMYSGDITVINILNQRMPAIGEKLRLCMGTFYVTAEKHQWNYGSSPTINYQIERGGDYSAGSFNPLKGISRPFAEIVLS